MEYNNLPEIAKRFWSIVRVLYFMFRKKLSQRQLMVDLNLIMKRGKIAGKALGNLIMHHKHGVSSSTKRRSHERQVSFNAAPHEYEFSCGNSPMFPFQLTRRNKHSHFFACTHAPVTEEEEVMTVKAVKKVLEMLNANDQIMSVEASPALPGFGLSPAMIRQLRVSDSPYPLNNVDDPDHRIDKAAEDFIVKFYSDLKKQKYTMSPAHC